MTFSSKAGWHLPFAILTVTLLLYVSLGLWFNDWMTARRARPPHTLDSIFSPETVDALYEDVRFHHAILELTETVAKASINYGDSLESGGLTDFGNTLMAEVTRFKTDHAPNQKKKRQSDNATELSSLFKQALSGISGDFVGGVASSAYFFGIGIGMGTENGLNLTTPDQAKAIATKVAAASGQQPTGANLVAQSLGSGLSAQLVPALGSLSTSNVPVGMVAFSLAQGIGQASASGLNLTQQQFAPTNSSDIISIARNLGLGVTGPIASSVDLQKLMSQAGGANDIMAQVPQIIAAAGEGLGQGASMGLGLMKSGTTGAAAKRQLAANSSQMDVPGLVGDLTRGLSQAFLESSNLSAIFPSGAANLNLDKQNLLSIATGAGKGIGEGIAEGMGAPTANISATLASQANATGMPSEAMLAEQFTRSLVSSLIQSGGLSAVGNTLTSQAGSLAANVDTAKAVEGAARGLIEGGVSALSEAGGFQKFLAGDFPKELAMNLPALPPTTFNDSTNGSIVSFMRGLSGEGVLLISQMLNAGNSNSSTANNVSSTPSAKRSVGGSGVVVPRHRLSRRAEEVTPFIDNATLGGIAQTALDTVTCSGFGGVAALVIGIMSSPAAKKASAADPNAAPTPLLDNSTLAALPKGPITITSEGNTFTLDIATQSVVINGFQLVPFAVITVLHILLSTLAFFFALPIYLALGAIWRLSDMIGHPINDAKMKKWRMIVLFGIFTPLAFAGVILGIVGKGSSAHFNTGHGILGLIGFIFVPPALYVSFVRLRTSVPIPPPSAFILKNQIATMKGPHKIHVIANTLVQQVLAFGMIAFMQGWSDLRSMSLCIVDAFLTAPTLVGLLNILLMVQIGTNGLLLARFLLERRIVKYGGGEHGKVELAGGDDQFNGRKRSDTMKTFGFDPKPDSPTLERRTADLLGRQDSQIGYPTGARKLGEQDAHPGARVISVASNPFVASQSQRGGYEDDRSPVANYRRPSSEIDPDRYQNYPRPRNESFSRPLKTPKTPTELGWNRDLQTESRYEEMPTTNPYDSTWRR